MRIGTLQELSANTLISRALVNTLIHFSLDEARRGLCFRDCQLLLCKIQTRKLPAPHLRKAVKDTQLTSKGAILATQIWLRLFSCSQPCKRAFEPAVSSVHKRSYMCIEICNMFSKQSVRRDKAGKAVFCWILKRFFAHMGNVLLSSQDGDLTDQETATWRLQTL